MDSHTFMDTVTLEKANAIARYRRFKNLAKLLQILELIVVLTLISWSSTCLPAVVKLAGHYLQNSLYFLNPHVVFLVGNAIVIALFILYRHHIDLPNNSVASDFHDDFAEKSDTYNSSEAAESPSLPAPVKEEEEMIDEEKQIVCEQNAVGETECEAAAKAINDAIRRIRKFERTKSEKLKRDICRKQLRRSETEVRRVEDQTIVEYENVEKLSNEEFRVAVEAFIEKQRKFLRQQKMAEYHYS